MSTLRDKLAGLSAERRQAVTIRGDELIAEELTLRQLREQVNMTQSAIAERLEIGQDSVSRMENRGDIKLSTLQAYVEALGGTLTISAELPNQEKIILQTSSN